MGNFAENEWRKLLEVLFEPPAGPYFEGRMRQYLRNQETKKLLDEITLELKNDWDKFIDDPKTWVSNKTEAAQADRLIPFTIESVVQETKQEEPRPQELPTVPETEISQAQPIDPPITLVEQKPEPMQFTPTTPPPPPPRPIPLRVSLMPIKMNEAVNIDLDDHPDLKWGDITEADFERADIEAIGLQYDKNTHRLFGKPTQQGEFTLDFEFKSKHEEGWLTSKFILFVNPDPRSLWKDEPTDPLLPYQKKDFDQKSDRRGTRTVVAASARGRSHAHEGKFRDDDFFIEADAASGWYFMAVADGAGSAKYSRKGSELACKSAQDFLRDSLTTPPSKPLLERFEEIILELKRTGSLGGDDKAFFQKLLVEVAFEAHKTIEREVAAPSDPKMAGLPSVAMRDYSTTFILAIAKKFDFGWFVGSFGVGDGGIAIYHDGQEPILLAEPDGGEFAGQTRFLTMPETFKEGVYARFKYHFLRSDEDFTALVLMTDGVTDPKFPTDNSLKSAAVWAEFWDDISKNVDFQKDNENLEAELLAWLNFWSPGNHDDRTIAILF